tara:strand:- start:79 stop:294 length:216 start_codon:yes stop_codon:yes gene_type:complete
MNKEEYKSALRGLLVKESLSKRKDWNENDLFFWWSHVTAEDSYLRWNRCRGDPWQYAKGMCSDLIGAQAMR